MNEAQLEYQEHCNNIRTNWGATPEYGVATTVCTMHAFVASRQANEANPHPVVASPHALISTLHGDIAPSVGPYICNTVINEPTNSA